MNLSRVRNYLEFLRHFENAAIVWALRVGWIRLPLFLYKLRKGKHSYQFLGRPKANKASDLFILREILIEETYRGLLPLLGKESIRLVDLGANIGAATVWLNHVHGVREAFCFEPDTESFRLCQFNLDKNGCNGSKAYPQAMGATSRQTTMSSSVDRPAQSSLYGIPTGDKSVDQPVEVISFSEWLAAHPGDFDLLKCDCEGAEWEILEKSPECFSRFKVVVIEVHRNSVSNTPIAKFPEALTRLGFSTIRWDARINGLYIGQRAA